MAFYGQDELIDLMNMCDLYVHASDAEIEGIGCMEAMACGLVPVISDSPLSATGQYALHGSSLFTHGDAGDLAAKIDYWIEHPEEKEAMAARYSAQQDANRVEVCAARMEDFYRDAIKAGSSPVPGEEAPARRRFLTPAPNRLNSRLLAPGNGPANGTRVFAAVVLAVLAPITRLVLGLRIRGKANLKSLEGGAVTVCNHVHWLDCAMLWSALLGRRLWIVSLRENFEIPVAGALIKWLGAVVLGGGAKQQAALQNALAGKLQGGDLVHYYAEGMLVPYHSGLRPMWGGAFAMAVRAQRPVLPMVLIQEKRRGLFALKRKPCFTLRILEPVYPDPAKPAKKARAEMQRQAEFRMRAWLEPRREPGTLPNTVPLGDAPPQAEDSPLPALEAERAPGGENQSGQCG